MRVPSSTSLRKMSDGVGESQSRPLSINSRSWSPLHLSLSSPTTPSPTALKPIPLMQPLEQSYPNRPHQRMVENGTQLPSSPRVSAWSSGTMRSTTRRCWPSSEHWRSGSTSLKAPCVSLKSGRTTKTSNTSAHLRSWTKGKLGGPYTYPGLTSHSTTTLEAPWASPMPYPNTLTMEAEAGTMPTSPCSDQASCNLSLQRSYSHQSRGRVTLRHSEGVPTWREGGVGSKSGGRTAERPLKVSTCSRVVQMRQSTPLLREDLCSGKSGAPTPDHVPTPWHQSSLFWNPSRLWC